LVEKPTQNQNKNNKMKRILALLVGLFCAASSLQAQCPTAPGTGVYVMFNSTYQMGTVSAGETHVKMCYSNTTTNNISGVQFRVWYDKNSFNGAAPVVTSLNTSFPQSLQFITDVTEGNITVTIAYTGNSATFSIPDGELFDLKLTHASNFATLASIPTPMSITGVTPFYNGASDINGLDVALTTHNYGGIFQQQMFVYNGNFKTVTGAGAKNIPVVLQKKVSAASTWTDVITSTTDVNGAFSFNTPIDATYYDIRLHVQGDALNFGNIVTTTDAQKVNDIVLGTASPVGFDFYSADVNGSNTITIADLYSVFGRIAGRFTAWPNNVKDVLFFTEPEYTTVNSATTSQRTTIPGVTIFDRVILATDPHTAVNFYVLGMGDANNTGFQMARTIPIEIANPANAPYHVIDSTIEFDNVSDQIELNLPTLNNIQEGNLINIPVKILSSNKYVGSMQFAVWYDQSLLEFKGIENQLTVSKWISYLNPEENIIDWGGYDALGESNLLSNNDVAFSLQFIAKKPQTEWGTSPLLVTRKAAGDNVYRDLNIRPTDGLVVINRLSNGSLVNIEGDTMIVYPNPTTGIITLAFNLTKGTKANLGVYTINGKKCVDVITENFPKGKYSYTIDLGDLASGTYVAVLTPDSNNELVAQKIIKQ